MIIRYSKTFKKRYKLLPVETRAQIDERLNLFKNNLQSIKLKLHPLKGKLSGYYSINISGDIRAVFKKDGVTVIFILVGTHSQLYK